MKRLSASALNRLLAGSPGLAPIDKHDVLQKVLQLTAAQRAPRWRTSAFRWGAIAMAAAAGLAIFVVQRQAPGDEFAARGAPAASFSMSCLQQGLAARCVQGAAVALKVSAPANAQFFSAVVLTTSGDAQWLVDNVDTRSLPPDGVLDRAPVLGTEQRGKRLEVVGVFASAALDKAQLRAMVMGSHPEVILVRQILVVEP